MTLSEKDLQQISAKGISPEKLEQQLNDFRTNLWNTKTVAEIRQDSINAAIAAANDTISTKKEKVVKKEKSRTGNTTTTAKRSTVKKENTVKSNRSSNTNHISVRRERR